MFVVGFVPWLTGSVVSNGAAQSSIAGFHLGWVRKCSQVSGHLSTTMFSLSGSKNMSYGGGRGRGWCMWVGRWSPQKGMGWEGSREGWWLGGGGDGGRRGRARPANYRQIERQITGKLSGKLGLPSSFQFVLLLKRIRLRRPICGIWQRNLALSLPRNLPLNLPRNLPALCRYVAL